MHPPPSHSPFTTTTTPNQPNPNPLNTNPGARTSFKAATGVRFADAAARSKARLPEAFGAAAWCDGYEARLGAAARTWLRPHAQDNLL